MKSQDISTSSLLINKHMSWFPHDLLSRGVFADLRHRKEKHEKFLHTPRTKPLLTPWQKVSPSHPEFGPSGLLGDLRSGRDPQVTISLFQCQKDTTSTGWWFGCQFLFSHILGISSSQLTLIFFGGVAQPPTS